MSPEISCDISCAMSLGALETPVRDVSLLFPVTSRSECTRTGSRQIKMALQQRKRIASGLLVMFSEDEAEDDEAKSDIPLLALLLTATMEGEEKSRIVDYVERVVPWYTENDFRRMFRMNPITFEALLQQVQRNPDLQPKGPGRRDPIPIDKQLYITLWYLGSTDTIMKIADRFGISESTVIMIRDRMLSTLLQLSNQIITLPNDTKKAEEETEFSTRNNFPGIIGALDGTHIRIKAPHEHPQSFVNRKGFHSIQLQCVCRHDMMFSDCFTGYPGSCHDARVLRNSDLWDAGENHCAPDYHILADGAYPLRPWLLTPFRDNGHLTAQQKKFNFYHSSNRAVIERAFALLKSRFRRLHYIDTLKTSTAVEIIMASCVLHNLCLIENDDIDDFLSQDVEDDDFVPNHNIGDQNVQGIEKRNRIAANLV